MAKRQNAYSEILKEKQNAATGESQEQQPQEATAEQSDTTAKPQNTVKSSKTVRAKITIYPDEAQVEKLYDLMEAYRKKTGIKVNQQDLLRRLIEVASIETLLP